MGEVESPQVLKIDDSRITLLEAITRTGGVTSNALLDRVAVIREEGNERRMYMHDIRSSDIFYSPCYYLQQNDMVYVHPKFAEANTKERRTLSFLFVRSDSFKFDYYNNCLIKIIADYCIWKNKRRWL